MKWIYRVHQTCEAGHKTYDDYASARRARKAIKRLNETEHLWDFDRLSCYTSKKWIRKHGCQCECYQNYIPIVTLNNIY